MLIKTVILNQKCDICIMKVNEICKQKSSVSQQQQQISISRYQILYVLLPCGLGRKLSKSGVPFHGSISLPNSARFSLSMNIL